MEDIIDAIRRVIGRWVLTTTQLTEDAHIGDTVLHVRTTKRFDAGEEFLIKDSTETMENRLIIASVTDNTTLTLSTPLRYNWLVSRNAAITKTLDDQFIKTIHFGEPSVIDMKSLPAITVNATTSHSEWYTTRATIERYNIEIGTFVVDAAHDAGTRFLIRVTDLIRKGLKRNIHPLVNSYDQTALLDDVLNSDVYIKVPDSSVFVKDNIILLEDQFVTEEHTVAKICDSTTIALQQPVSNAFTVANTKVIKPHRLIHNSWPSEATYGKINKGTLCKSSVINFFVEETELQLNGGPGGGWQDTQLS